MKRYESRLVFILLLTVGIVLVFNFHDVNATSLSQRYGNNYSTHQTSNTGTVYGPAPNNGVSTTGYTIPVGATITSVGVKIAATGGPTAFSVSSGVSYAQHQTGNTGFVIVPAATGSVQPFVLPAGSTIDHVGIHIFATGGGNVRVKIYDSVTGLPNNLLGESGTVAIGSTGWVYIPVSATAPADGKIFATYEFDNTNTDVYTLNPPSSVTYGRVAHVFGAGPNPFGTESFPNNLDYPVIVNYTSPQPHIRVKVYDSVSGNPKHLLGESGSLPISGTGWQNFTVNAVTNTTQTYVAYELDNSNTDIYFKNPDFAIPIQTHVYGSGPNPMSPSFTANIGYTSLVNYNTLTQLTLVPTSGNVGSTVTVSGSGFTSANTNATNNFHASSISGLSGTLYAEKQTGVPSGGVIDHVGVNVTSLGIGNFQAIDNFQASNTAGWAGNIWAERVNVPTTGFKLTSAQFNVTNAAGKMRVAIYDDSGTYPVNLLGSSVEITPVNGINSIPLNIKVPSSDGKLFLAFEGSDNTLALKFTNNGANSVYPMSHTYGTSFPATFQGGILTNANVFYNSINYTITASNVRVKIYSDSGTFPNNLLGESVDTTLTHTGVNLIPVSATTTTPTTWIGLETNNTNLGVAYTSSGILVYQKSHSYGTGPNPFGSASSDTTAFWNQVIYNSPTVTLKFSGTLLTTIPSLITTDSTGSFSGVTFTVPSSTAGSHVVNASDTGGLWAIATYSVNASYTLQLRPTLSDNTTMLTSAKVFLTNTTGTFSQLANNTGWVKFTGISGSLNMTVFDDKNFESLKLINYSPTSSVTKNLATYDYALNCIGYYTGYQSDFIVRINDTDGTYITSMSKPDCTSLTDMTWSMTFAGLGKSNNVFSTSMLTSIGNLAYQANAKQFTVNGNNVTTIFTGNTNLISNSFPVGGGLTNHTLNFDIKLGSVQTVTPNPTGSPNPPPPPPNTCTDPLGCSGNQCQYGINPDGTCFDPTCVYGENCNHLQCPPNSTLYNNECLATQPQVCPDGSQAINGICNSGVPSCPANTILINGACVTTSNQLCPDGSAPVNGLCSNGPVQCTGNTVLLNGECVVVSPTNQCALGVNPDGTCITSVQQSQCTANPLLCLLGGGAGGKVTVSGITYTPTVDIVQLGQIKNEVIGVSWDSSSDLIIGGLYFSGNSSFVFNPTPQAPYNITGSTISQTSSGQIKYVLTVPSSYCSQTVTTNCLDPKVSTFVVPVSVTAILDGKDVRNTIFLKITVLTQQTIATYLILGLALFAIFAIILSRRKDKTKSRGRRNVQVKSSKNKQQYLSKR